MSRLSITNKPVWNDKSICRCTLTGMPGTIIGTVPRRKKENETRGRLDQGQGPRPSPQSSNKTVIHFIVCLIIRVFVIPQWHELSKEAQSKYYERARQERQLHMCLYPGWSARENYARHKKRGGGKKHETQKKSSDYEADLDFNESNKIFVTFHGDDNDDDYSQGLSLDKKFVLIYLKSIHCLVIWFEVKSGKGVKLSVELDGFFCFTFLSINLLKQKKSPLLKIIITKYFWQVIMPKNAELFMELISTTYGASLAGKRNF